MQFDDPKTTLDAAAAKPTRGIDASALVKQGRRLRRARYTAVAAGLAVTLVGATASLGLLGDRNGGVPPAHGTGCDDPRWWILARRGCVGEELCDRPPAYEASVYLRDNATRPEILELRSTLMAAPGVEEVRHVSKKDAYDELRRLYEDKPELTSSISPRDLPASLRVQAADDATLERLRAVTSPIVDEIRTSGEFIDRLCGERR